MVKNYFYSISLRLFFKCRRRFVVPLLKIHFHHFFSIEIKKDFSHIRSAELNLGLYKGIQDFSQRKKLY